MSESVLYRKYRPKELKDVVGQDHIVNALSSAIKSGRISHAYLFSGSRGIGKTSIARIFAKEIGCADDDVYEIDAASNTGVEHVRELRDSVYSLPLRSPYKLYIIDEVHMLSKQAFNALLKTLEEPPAHVVFVLATTEQHKLPDTVISRCELHEFRRPNTAVLSEVITSTAEKEGFKLEPRSAELIAVLAEGSFRDAQSILQKITTAVQQKNIKHEEIENITGAPKAELIESLVSAVDAQDTEAALKAINTADEANIDMKIFLQFVLQKMRFVLLLRLASGVDDMIKRQVGEDEFKTLQKMAGSGNTGLNSKTLSEFILAGERFGKAYIATLPLELAVLKTTNAEEKNN